MMRSTVPSVLATLAGCIVLAGSASAQIRYPGTPATEMFEMSSDVESIVLDRPDIESMMAEDEAREDFTIRYGAVIKTSLGLDNAGTWTDLSDYGLKVWRLRLVSPGAHTLGVTFDLFRMPVGAKVFLYSADKREVIGAYTHESNADSMILGIEPVVGDDIVIELVTPSVTVEPPLLNVGEVIHDYRNVREPIFYSGRGGGQAGGCTIYINCPEGANYQDIKRSSVRTLSGGALCSGAILNNTNADNTPYLLTANHCGGMSGGQFKFNYEYNGCGTGGTNNGQNLSGAQFLASRSSGNPCGSSNVDSQLYRLNNSIPASYNAFYAGWNRTTNQSGGGPAVTIGHGSGAQKNMAIDANGASSCTNWWQTTWSTGVIVGGNSGGPLFDGNKRVIGPLCCGSAISCVSQTIYFGKLGVFWNTTNISQYLDPAGTGATVIDGKEHAGVTCSPLPSNYGVAEISSTFGLASIGYTGTPSATTNDFVLTGSSFKANSFGWLLTGDGNTPNVSGIGTILVSQPNFLRILAGTTNAAGDISLAMPVTGAMVGNQQYFQWAVRDPGWGDGITLSNGLDVTYCP